MASAGSAGSGPSAAPPPYATPGPSATQVPPVGSASAGMGDNTASALCYIPFGIGLICSIAFLVIAPYNQSKFVRFNAFQSLGIHLAWFVGFILLGIVAGMLHVVGIFGIGLLYPLLGLGGFILLIYLAYSAYNNQKVMIPVIGEFADKQA